MAIAREGSFAKGKRQRIDSGGEEVRLAAGMKNI
jgi:hypothetical protein